MRARSQHGFTLLELIIAVLIALILVAGTYRLFIAQSRAVETSQAVSEMQDNGRTAMDFLVRDIRQAGFLIASNSAAGGNQPIGALRIENNCGGQANGGVRSPDIKSNTGILQLGGNSAVSSGQIVGTPASGAGATACPGGSDRLMIVFRPRPDYSTGAEDGQGSSLQLPLVCPSNGPSTYDCNAPFANGGLNTSCGGGCSSAGVMMCDGTDPNKCIRVWVQPKPGGPGCNGGTCGSANNNSSCRVDVYTAAGCSGPISGQWGTGVVPSKSAASFNGYTFRTYQLMDLDGDGSTELVYSDDVEGQEASGTGTVNWTVVANNIDDFQVAYETKKYPGTFNSGSLLNFGSGNCTEGGTASFVPTGFTSHEKEPECTSNLYTNSDYPTSLRISIVARTTKKVLQAGTETVINSYRTQLEDNNPAQQAFSATTPNWNASGDGNAQGFQRRTLTEVVSLRNLTGFAF